MRALAILPFAFVIPLAEALADHSWLYAAPLGVLVAVGLVAMAPGSAAPEPPLAQPPVAAPATLASAVEAGGSMGHER